MSSINEGSFNYFIVFRATREGTSFAFNLYFNYFSKTRRTEVLEMRVLLNLDRVKFGQLREKSISVIRLSRDRVPGHFEDAQFSEETQCFF